MPTRVMPVSNALLSESVELKMYLVMTGVLYIHNENKASQTKNCAIKAAVNV
jgi:hypothetical protein